MQKSNFLAFVNEEKAGGPDILTKDPPLDPMRTPDRSFLRACCSKHADSNLVSSVQRAFEEGAEVVLPGWRYDAEATLVLAAEGAALPSCYAVRKDAWRKLRSVGPPFVMRDGGDLAVRLLAEGAALRSVEGSPICAAAPGRPERTQYAKDLLARLDRIAAGVLPRAASRRPSRLPHWHSYRYFFFMDTVRGDPPAVCTKIFKGSPAGDWSRASREMLDRLRPIRSRRIARTLDYGYADGERWFRMEGFPGAHRLSDFDPRTLDRTVRLAWAREILEGARELLAAGVFPYEISPSNLMVDGDRVVWIDLEELLRYPEDVIPSTDRIARERFAFVLFHLLARSDFRQRADAYRDQVFVPAVRGDGPPLEDWTRWEGSSLLAPNAPKDWRRWLEDLTATVEKTASGVRSRVQKLVEELLPRGTEQAYRFDDDLHLIPLGITQRKISNLGRVIPADLKGRSVLDIGCSKGFFSFFAASRGADRVVGIDPNAEAIHNLQAIQRETRWPVEFHLQTFGQDVLKFGQFDWVFALSCYHYLYRELKSHHAVFDLLRRLCKGYVLWEGPLEVDDNFAKKTLDTMGPEGVARYNHHLILSEAAAHFGRVEFKANSGLVRTRDILLLSEPRTEPDRSWDNEWNRAYFKDGIFYPVGRSQPPAAN